MSVRGALLVGVANAAFIGYLAHHTGAERHMIVLAIVAVAIGTTGGMVAADWLEENGYTMESAK